MKKKLTLAIVDQLVNSGSSFVCTILLARALDELILGLFLSFNLFYLMCQSIQHSVISAPAYSLVPKIDEYIRRQKYFVYLIQRQIFLSFLCLCVYAWVGVILIISNNLTLSILTYIHYGFVLLALLAFDFTRKWLIANRRYKILVVVSTARYLIQIAGIAFLSNIGSDKLIELANILMLATALSIAVAIINENYYFNLLLSSNYRIDRKTHAQHQKAALDLLPGAIMQWTSGGTYELQALKLLGPSVFGVIKIVQSFVSPLNLINQFAENWLIVLFSTKKIERKRKLLDLYRLRGLIKTVSGIIFGIWTVNLVSPYLLSLLYGPEYIEYGFMVTGYLISLLLVVLNTAIRSYLTAKHSTTIIKFAYGGSTAFALGSSYYLVQNFKLYGVIFGAISSQIILLMCMVGYAYKTKDKSTTFIK